MVAAWEQARAREAERATIQADEAADTNPWLRITGWARYLDGVHPRDLQQLVEALEEDPEDHAEQVQYGAGIHVEAARTEAGQAPY
ncbi:hypothetical protein BJX66DRAFT_345752 [Aspergillus keveii]|uniref:Uncharacterized protein n=1 Tax=Aspergillus keveii TaxID=714993 RepID=A0ABR4FH08_9EURO